MDCITGFGIVSDIVINQITSDQVARRSFGNFFVTFGIPKMIVVNLDGMFSGVFNETFQYALLVPVHEVERAQKKANTNEG